jgi:hypothetical protein
MASPLKTVLGITVIILVGVVGYVAPGKYPTNPGSNLENTAPRSAKQFWSFYHSQRRATDERADEWKSYTNSKYGFSLKYPKNWFVQEVSPELIGFCPTRGGLPCRQSAGGFNANILIEVYENPKELKVREYLFVERYGKLPENLKELIINGYPAIRLGPEGTCEATVYLAKDNYVYKLQSYGFDNSFGKMIRTLKFLER